MSAQINTGVLPITAAVVELAVPVKASTTKSLAFVSMLQAYQVAPRPVTADAPPFMTCLVELSREMVGPGVQEPNGVGVAVAVGVAVLVAVAVAVAVGVAVATAAS